MSIHRVDVPSVELLASGVGIGNVLLHGFGEQPVERGDIGEPPRALEGFEKMARRNAGQSLVGMELEELLPGGRTAQAAQHADLAVLDVGDIGAAVRPR